MGRSFKDVPELYAFLRSCETGRPLIQAHRGGPRQWFPENCLATFERAVADGAGCLEVDVRKIKDGTFVLHHDTNLGRTAFGQGAVSDHTLEELKPLVLMDSRGAKTEHSIPTLAEAIDWAQGRTILFLDFKEYGADFEGVLGLVRRASAQPYCIPLTLGWDDTVAVRRLAPELLQLAYLDEYASPDVLRGHGITPDMVLMGVTSKMPPDRFDAWKRDGFMVEYDTFWKEDDLARRTGVDAYRPVLEKRPAIISTEDILAMARALNILLK